VTCKISGLYLPLADRLPTCFLKEVAVKVALALSMVFQAFLDQCVQHDVWKIATIVPEN